MPDLLDRIRDELKQRLDASRAAAQEYERLQAALAALDQPGPAGTTAPSASDAKPKTTRRKTARSAARRRNVAKQRAPHGQNRQRVLEVVRERPGVTPMELASASGVKGPTLYTLLRRLVDDGTLERRELPGNDAGYSLNPDQQPA